MITTNFCQKWECWTNYLVYHVETSPYHFDSSIVVRPVGALTSKRAATGFGTQSPCLFLGGALAFFFDACIYRHLYGFVLSSQSNIRNCITSRRKGLYITCGTFGAARKSERQEGHICYNIDIPESHVRYLYPIGSYVISLQWVLSDCIMLCPNISQRSPHAWHVQRPFMAIKCGQRPIL